MCQVPRQLSVCAVGGYISPVVHLLLIFVQLPATFSQLECVHILSKGMIVLSMNIAPIL